MVVISGRAATMAAHGQIYLALPAVVIPLPPLQTLSITGTDYEQPTALVIVIVLLSMSFPGLITVVEILR
jgi:hypothetical protein